MARAYHPNIDFLILDECHRNEQCDWDALMGLRFEAPAPGPKGPGPNGNSTSTPTLHYNGITRPPLGPNGKPDTSLPSLQVRVLTGELHPDDIKIVRDILNVATNTVAPHALRAN